MKSNIILIGSSFIKKMNLNGDLNGDGDGDYNIINHGISRLTTQKLLDPTYISSISHSFIPRTIVFYCGNNDLIQGVDKKIICENITRFLYVISTIYPTSKILIIGLLLSPLHVKLNKTNDIHYINSYLRRISLDRVLYSYINVNRQVSNYYSLDNIHLNKKGYAILNQILYSYL
jgi:lysophospholipase L1-like esterase